MLPQSLRITSFEQSDPLCKSIPYRINGVFYVDTMSKLMKNMMYFLLFQNKHLLVTNLLVRELQKQVVFFK